MSQGVSAHGGDDLAQHKHARKISHAMQPGTTITTPQKSMSSKTSTPP
eukprot:CAMPEP_0119343194 /NCGR_PEP_ID=MMETSP1333-20130426/106317_1 /TAXON_ID=418940 /ORGANISM="Scyphosphaera apsteinii, Strain RCC1455" /LENGTH=47 /DNA_ID= /DNA_START= /DNA_END= /DNA_ORIENTATION=